MRRKSALLTLAVGFVAVAGAASFGAVEVFSHREQAAAEQARAPAFPPPPDVIGPVLVKWPRIEEWAPNPAASFPIKVIDYKHFRIGYDEQAKNPAWVAYRLSGPITIHGQEKRPATFATDFQTAAHVSHHDYSSTGFDRGHMCPAYAMFSRYGDAGMKETFVMSNVIPQYHGLNAGEWEQLEVAIAGRDGQSGGWAEKYGPLWVINGPVYDRRPATERLKNGTWVPIACFSIVVRQSDSKWDALAFVMPNKKDVAGPISRYLTTINAIELATHIHLMSGVDTPLNLVIEQQRATEVWR